MPEESAEHERFQSGKMENFERWVNIQFCQCLEKLMAEMLHRENGRL
jgi:hypothetical protein